MKCATGFLAYVIAIALALPACDTLDEVSDDRSGEMDERPAGVARGAEMVELGRGDLRFVAPARGAVYGVDATTGRTLISREIAAGQEFALDVGEDEVHLDGRPVMKRDLKSDHTHAVWFRAARKADREKARGDDDGDLPKELRDARRIAAGTGDLAFTAPTDGNVFLYDNSSRRVVYRSPMQKGERLSIDATENLIERDGVARNPATAERNRLYPNRQYTIFFDEE